MQRMGGDVTPITGVEFSSVSKGESLEDTVLTLAQYSDIIALRHPDVGSANRAAAVSSVPIINAGDGIGEHPTQALLDLYTIWKRFKSIEDLVVCFVGDLKYGRTVHSLVKLLDLYGTELKFVSPKSLRLPIKLLNKLHGSYEQNESYESTLREVDVLYVTRIQKERFKDSATYDKVKNSYVLSLDSVNQMKESAVVMHPFPRVNEISPEVDNNSRAVYFEQIQNGMYLRMALLANCLNQKL